MSRPATALAAFSPWTPISRPELMFRRAGIPPHAIRAMGPALVAGALAEAALTLYQYEYRGKAPIAGGGWKNAGVCYARTPGRNLNGGGTSANPQATAIANLCLSPLLGAEPVQQANWTNIQFGGRRTSVQPPATFLDYYRTYWRTAAEATQFGLAGRRNATLHGVRPLTEERPDWLLATYVLSRDIPGAQSQPQRVPLVLSRAVARSATRRLNVYYDVPPPWFPVQDRPTRPQPVAGYSPVTYPTTEIEVVQPVTRPVGRVTRVSNSVHVQRKYAEPEKKGMARRQLAGLMSLNLALNNMTELMDFVGILYSSLPDEIRAADYINRRVDYKAPAWERRMQQLRRLERYWDRVDLDKFARKLLANQMQDAFYGGTSQKATKALQGVRKASMGSGDFGIGADPLNTWGGKATRDNRMASGQDPVSEFTDKASNAIFDFAREATKLKW